MSVKTCKVEPVKGQTSLTSRKTKQDVVKPYLVSSSSSTKASRSPFVSQKTSRRVASSAEDIKNAHKEATKITSSSCEASKWTGYFILMVELRRKIITFRSIIDLPTLTCYLSITNMVMRTMKDLHKLCPEIIESSQILDMRRAGIDKLLDYFYNALKSIGDSWIDDHEWIIKSKYKNSSIRKNLSDRLVEKVLAALDGLIKGMNERLNTTEISIDEMKKKASLLSKTSGGRSESLAKQPITPRTVLSPSRKVKDFAISVSNLPRNVRMQALVKLSPIDVKRLGIQNICQKEAQSNNGNGDDESVKEKKSETKKIEKAKEAMLEEQDSVKNQIDDKNCSKVSVKSKIVPKSLAQPPGNAAIAVQPPLPGKGLATPPLPGSAAPLLPPTPLPMAAGKEVAAPSLPPPGAAALMPPLPLPTTTGKGMAAPSLPPPGAAAVPPLPTAAEKGPAAPPGARGSLGAKKSTSKLKRSTHLGALFRFFMAKLEGKNPEVRSRGAEGGNKGGIGRARAIIFGLNLGWC